MPSTHRAISAFPNVLLPLLSLHYYFLLRFVFNKGYEQHGQYKVTLEKLQEDKAADTDLNDSEGMEYEKTIKWESSHLKSIKAL